MKVILIVATRETERGFYTGTATGRSIAAFGRGPFELRLFANNKEGLPSVYNEVIEQVKDPETLLVFAHDDLHLLDYFWHMRLYEAAKRFHVVGLAGNKRRVPRQPSWAFTDTSLQWDAAENLSGVVGHGKGFPPENLSVFGPPRQAVKLLDGLLIAVFKQTIKEHQLAFDERFDFHFYDMDFCRQVEERGLVCGTVDLALIHESGGAFNTDAWQSAYQTYLAKWGD